MEDDSMNERNDAFAVTRTIPISGADPGELERAIQNLGRIECVAYARASGNGRLRVRYDASCVGFRDIERLLDEAGVSRPSSFWWRIRSAWYAFLDQNARSNAIGGGGACCNKPPGIGTNNPPRQ
ncbi:MAG: hypothetical protein WBX11_09060 [Thiobacillaceae bacterium]